MKLKTFSLLSIGQRGVGKTVFMAGSYAEVHSGNQANHSGLWFDCQDSQAQENMERILGYVAATGQYPPATMKITDFNFSLKCRSSWGVETLCHFRWWDLPGELCNTRNPDFQNVILNSHGCCVFVNAAALVHDQSYLQALEAITKQVVAIASLVSQHGLRYPFALILTKYDLLDPGPLGLLQIEENLQPLTTRMDAVKANYQRFYSAIPIASTPGASALIATGAAASLLWLVSELRKSHSLQPQRNLASGLAQGSSQSASKAAAVKHRFGLKAAPRSILILVLAGISLLGVAASAFYTRSQFTPASEQAQASDNQIREYEQILQREPDNPDALINLANLHMQQGQPDQAIPLIERLIQQKPQSLDLRMNLAQLYELTGQKQRAETTYDQILAQQKQHFMALISKGVLRSEQGDTQTAKTLFAQAEQFAPNDFKPRIRAIAQNTLQSPTESMPPAK